MDLTLVRHGQTDANLERRFQPPDEPLNQAGRREVEEAARRLAGRSFQGMMCGTATRVLETARPILAAVHAGQLGCCRALDEIGAGILTGLTFEEAHRLHPRLSEEIFGSWPDFSFPKSRRFADFCERSRSLALWLASWQGPGPWLLVGSEGPLMSIACLAAGMPPERMFDIQIPNGGVLEVSL